MTCIHVKNREELKNLGPKKLQCQQLGPTDRDKNCSNKNSHKNMYAETHACTPRQFWVGMQQMAGRWSREEKVCEFAKTSEGSKNVCSGCRHHAGGPNTRSKCVKGLEKIWQKLDLPGLNAKLIHLVMWVPNAL